METPTKHARHASVHRTLRQTESRECFPIILIYLPDTPWCHICLHWLLKPPQCRHMWQSHGVSGSHIDRSAKRSDSHWLKASIPAQNTRFHESLSSGTRRTTALPDARASRCPSRRCQDHHSTRGYTRPWSAWCCACMVVEQRAMRRVENGQVWSFGLMGFNLSKKDTTKIRLVPYIISDDSS